ncbi:unnamed protein product [Allacma fusca]|uniref:SAM domain-containing protein n=1 Tax=Allacma fusca TaxID=39272 RepID=A0A8J2L904_9HEXA|nr:unnamed protein product [Allacma fusca]
MFSVYPSSQATDTSDTVSESSDNATLLSLSREDLTSIGAGPIREDVRVSRKKLETLILRERGLLGESKGFMDTLMEGTNTFIQWPSRMKIGAKTKKDLYVRIYGHTDEQVNIAKMQILMELGPHRDLRITLKMEISYTDHSHLIGCRGATIRRVMEDTGCHIHFPDSNRMSKDHKSNQVTIAGGSIHAVEQARSRVRELSPLIFQFNLPTIQMDHQITESHHIFIEQLQSAYSVAINIHPPNKLQQTTISIKGCEVDAPKIKEAIVKLASYFSGGSTNNNQLNLVVESTMEISPVQHSFVRSVNDSNCHTIMMNTGAKIIFPDLTDSNIQQIKRSRVYIVGEINAVYFARQQLLGCLPLRMIFDLADDHQLDWDNVRLIGSELNVNIKLINRSNRTSNASLPPPLPGRSRTIQIIACERNTNNIYEARKRILGLSENYNANIPQSYGLRGVFPSNMYLHHQQSTVQLPPNNPPNPPNRLTLPPLMLPPMSPSVLSPVLSPSFWPPAPFSNTFCSPTIATCCVLPSYTSPRFESNGQQVINGTTDILESVRSKAPGWERTNNTQQSSIIDEIMSSNSSPTSTSTNGVCGSSSSSLSNTSSVVSTVSPTESSKKYLAMKAMYNSKINGQARVPNSEWAGYGFSKTQVNLIPQPPPPPPLQLELDQGEDKKLAGPKHHPILHTQQSNLLDFAAKLDSEAHDLTTLFIQNSLEKYVDTFVSEEIDLDWFKTLTESDLRNLGVSSYPARKKMLLLIAQLSCRNNNIQDLQTVPQQWN